MEQELIRRTFLFCLATNRNGARLFFRGGVMSYPLYVQSIVAVWRKSVAPSLHFPLPQLKFMPTIRGWHRSPRYRFSVGTKHVQHRHGTFIRSSVRRTPSAPPVYRDEARPRKQWSSKDDHCCRPAYACAAGAACVPICAHLQHLYYIVTI